MRRSFPWILGASIATCLAVGGLGALATQSSVSSWYQELSRPPWTPPDAVFGPVWTLLYVMMAVAFALVWRAHGQLPRRAATLFGLQLALNLAWSFLFFGLRRPDLALVDILMLFVAIVATIAEFRRHDKVAGGLLAPYLLWVAYAASLNAGIVWLNR